MDGGRHSKVGHHLSGNKMLKNEAATSFFSIYHKGIHFSMYYN